MNRMTGAQLIVALLERQGICTVAGIPGGANLPLYDALSQSRQIRHVLARHEQGAGFIAQGMARATDQPAVCLATSGPGATNILTAIADAKLDSIPVICITGQVPTAMIGTDAFQEVDTYGMSIPITKHNFLVRSAAELLEVIPDAFHIATSGRPGPVLIDVPKDVQTQTVEFADWPAPGKADAPLALDHTGIERAAAMINAAQRPILYLGGGVIHSDSTVAAVYDRCSTADRNDFGAHRAPLQPASALATFLAEKAGLPTTMTLLALGAMPFDHELSLGMPGMHAARYTNLALEECDLLIAIGARFDDRVTGKVAEFCPQAQIIHVDIDPAELDKIKTAHIGLVADAGEALAALLPLVAANPRRAWRQRIAELKRRHPLHLNAAAYDIIAAVAKLAGDDAIITTDVGQHQMWVAQAYPLRKPRRWLTSGGLGTMGFGLPSAIGAALACPDKTVVCFSGDGSLLMNIQELATAAELGVNVKIVLMNNNALGMIRQHQAMFYGHRIFSADYQVRVDFRKIAEGFGVRAFELADLDAALAHDGPSLIHAPIDAEELVTPIVPAGAANKEMIGGETHAHA